MRTEDVYVVVLKDHGSLMGIVEQFPIMNDDDGCYVDGHVVVRPKDDYGRRAYFAMSIVERIEFVEQAIVEFKRGEAPVVTLVSDAELKAALATFGEDGKQ